ncbi:WhiB family transcriptional regulator [Thermomonospora umbrina]|uniref:Transcriptional regulator WhiB n=1 Tax=Thermomonospora umbrina TaxID=111806 RepID=A0A3D9T6I3_9ACTN|nr:WhiB family transcriptional regulator [Thermomonospora umbrina]REF00265.1 transcription factor WhiB [Thermomonospora umbrina]
MNNLPANDMPWSTRAACAGMPVNLFFPPERDEVAELLANHSVVELTTEVPLGREQREAKAKDVCAACPVRDACLDWAIAHDERHGTWGGTTSSERAALRRWLTRRGELPAHPSTAIGGRCDVGRCGECDRVVGLSAGGKIARHGTRAEWCAGSGQPPADATAQDVAAAS